MSWVRPGSAWTALWSRVADASTFVLVRTAFAFVIVLDGITMLPDLELVFADGGLNRHPWFFERQYLTPFRWVDGTAVLYASFGLMMLTGMLAVAGTAVRLTLPVAAMIHLGLGDYSWPWTFAASYVLSAWTMMLVGACLVTPTRFLGRWPGAEGRSGVAPLWPLYLIRVQLVIIYFVTAVERARGSEWREGSAVFHALQIDYYQRFPAPDFFVNSRPLIMLVTWGTLALEFALPALLLHPRTRRIAVGLVVVLHLGFELFLELGVFGPAMIVGALAFLDPRDSGRILRWMSRRFGAITRISVRRPRPVSPGPV